MNSTSGSKQCTKCKIDKPRSDFGKASRRKDGLQTWCKICLSRANAAWRAANPGVRKAYCAAWHVAHLESEHAKTAEWAERNPDRVRASWAKHRAKYRVEIMEAMRSRRAADPSYARRIMAKSYRKNRLEITARNIAWRRANRVAVRAMQLRRRARVAGAVNTLTARQIDDAVEMSCGLCAYCLKPYAAPTIDHVIAIARGGDHAADNIVVACRPCNSRKHARRIFVMLEATQ